ncbi:MAG: hypothetical protein IKM08_00115 [Clostridia bacterium]|nr:hypothetical protein [Clostridia bacterium]
MIPAIKQSLLLGECDRPRMWSVEFSPGSSIGVRRDLARDLEANVAIGAGLVRNDFDRIPIFQRPIFNATWDKAEQTWINLTPREDPTFSWSPTEPYREVIYRCQPFWYKLDMSKDYAPTYVSVSDRPLEGFALAPMFQNGRDFVYRPCFELTLGEDGLPHSRAGKLPLRSDLVTMMAHARAYDSAARTESIRDWFSDALLQLVEFARWDFNNVMTGNTAAVQNSGAGLIDLQASSGCAANGAPCAWRGKENPWKNMNSVLCDVLLCKDTSLGAVTLCYLDDMRHFDGTANEHYQTAGIFCAQVNGNREYCGFAMGSNFFYPARDKITGAVGKGAVYLYINGATIDPLAVGVGGNSTTNLLTTNAKPSPLNFECADMSNWRVEHFGARLVLDKEVKYGTV